MPLVVWIMIISENINTFQHEIGKLLFCSSQRLVLPFLWASADGTGNYLGNAAAKYGGSPAAGYVGESSLATLSR